MTLDNRNSFGVVRQLSVVLLACGLLFSVSAPASQNRNRLPPSAQVDRAQEGLRRPNPVQTRPLPDIIATVQSTPPYSGMDYIGVAGYEPQTMVYTLRFLDGRQVVVVHVDARSGRILRRAP